MNRWMDGGDGLDRLLRLWRGQEEKDCGQCWR